MISNDPKGNSATVDWRPDPGLVAEMSLPPRIDVSPADVVTFQRDGVILLKNLFPEWVEPLRAGLQRNMDEAQNYAFPCDSVAPGGNGRFFDSYCNWHRIPEYQAFVSQSAAAHLAAQFMRSKTAQLFHEHVFCKESGTQTATPWHHDLPYYCVDGIQNISVYVALDTTPAETAVRFLAGSHRTGQLYFPRHFVDGSDYAQDDSAMTSVTPLIESFKDSEIRSFALEPGDVILFDFRTLHGTTDAPVQKRRRAFSTRWLGDDMVYCERAGETSPPLKDLGVKPGARMPSALFPVFTWDDTKSSA
jgi:ectoine hydroxylase-related dioxygenase (phytanoyl-CoA dioxygenase family)